MKKWVGGRSANERPPQLVKKVLAGLFDSLKFPETTKNLREFFTYMMVLITVSLSGMLGMPPGCSVDRLAAVTA